MQKKSLNYLLDFFGLVCTFLAEMGGKGSGGKNRLPEAKKQEIKTLLVEGNGVLEIANKVACSATTVQKIRHEIKDKIPSWRERTIKNLTRLHSNVVEDLQENYQNVPPAQKGILLGILSDKIRDLNADNNTTVTHNHLHITHKDINGLFSQNPAPKSPDSGAIET